AGQLLGCCLRRLHDFTTEALKYGSGVAEFKGGRFSDASFVIISDPMNVNHVLTKKESDFWEVLEPLGDGIFRSDSDVWKAQRKLMLSAMHDKRFEIFSGKCKWQKVEKGLIPVLEHVSELGIQVDLQELFQRITFGVVGLLVFGFYSNSISVEFPLIPREKAFDDIEKAVFIRCLMPKLFILRRLFLSDA
ncbi:hypothetical protein Ddye_004569, partial [Dipteronia dyeriana]